MCRVGILSKYSRNLLLKLTSILVYGFYDYFLNSFLYGPYVRETDLDGAKILNDSTEKCTQQFFTWYSVATNTQWFDVNGKRKN